VNRVALRDALLAAGVPPDSFQLPGVHDSTPLPTDFWFVRPSPDGPWELGPYERGTYDVREILPTEAAACARLHQILLGVAPA
jgi:hypothetical protein